MEGKKKGTICGRCRAATSKKPVPLLEVWISLETIGLNKHCSAIVIIKGGSHGDILITVVTLCDLGRHLAWWNVNLKCHMYFTGTLNLNGFQTWLDEWMAWKDERGPWTACILQYFCFHQGESIFAPLEKCFLYYLWILICFGRAWLDVVIAS